MQIDCSDWQGYAPQAPTADHEAGMAAGWLPAQLWEDGQTHAPDLELAFPWEEKGWMTGDTFREVNGEAPGRAV